MRRQTWLVCLAIMAVVLSASVSYAGTYRTITINNDYADWVGVPVLDSDGGDNGGGPDIGDTQIANDDTNLYIRNTFPNNDSMQMYIALDIDSNTSTGYDIFGAGLIGSEAGWQNDFAFCAIHRRFQQRQPERRLFWWWPCVAVAFCRRDDQPRAGDLARRVVRLRQHAGLSRRHVYLAVLDG